MQPPVVTFFICSPGGNFTYASWCLSLCYCFSYIIVPPTCCHSNWRRKRKDRGEGKKKQFQSLQKKKKKKKKPVGITSPPSSSASVSVFIYFFQSDFQSWRLCRLHKHRLRTQCFYIEKDFKYTCAVQSDFLK